MAALFASLMGVAHAWPSWLPNSKTINCTLAVNPIDSAPIRSPQVIHTMLLSRFAGKDIAEIGTRNGDGMDCFARVTKAAYAIEMQPAYCKKLEVRAAGLKAKGFASYEVHCQKYQDGTPDVDIYTWWQQHPMLQDGEVIDAKAEAYQTLARTQARIVCKGLRWFESFLADAQHTRDAETPRQSATKCRGGDVV
jgi:hypothetical protein